MNHITPPIDTGQDHPGSQDLLLPLLIRARQGRASHLAHSSQSLLPCGKKGDSYLIGG